MALTKKLICCSLLLAGTFFFLLSATIRNQLPLLVSEQLQDYLWLLGGDYNCTCDWKSEREMVCDCLIQGANKEFVEELEDEVYVEVPLIGELEYSFNATLDWTCYNYVENLSEGRYRVRLLKWKV